jgi:hypothetical protein
LRLPPVKKVLVSQQVKSRYLEKLVERYEQKEETDRKPHLGNHCSD